jgi:hypothetical protein
LDQASWHVQIVDLGVTVSPYHALSLNLADQPQIVYLDPNKKQLNYATWADSVWTSVNIIDLTEPKDNIAVTRDAEYHLHISYHDVAKHRIEYLRQESGGWNKEIIAAKAWYGQDHDLALDAAGRAHISYSIDGELRYIAQGDNNWPSRSVASGLGLFIPNALALDSKSLPHLLYYDANKELLTYARFDGLSWKHDPIVKTPYEAPDRHFDIAIDATDRPHITYYDTRLGSLRYGVKTGEFWRYASIDDRDKVGREARIAIDQAGNPRISYHGRARTLEYAAFDGAAWHTDVVAYPETILGDAGLHPMLRIDSQQQSQIVYYELGLMTNLAKYAHFNGSSWVLDRLLLNRTIPAFDLATADWPHLLTYNPEDGQLQYRFFSLGDWHTLELEPRGNFGPNAALELDENDKPHIVYYDEWNNALKYGEMKP